jgi:hypothetical protein
VSDNRNDALQERIEGLGRDLARAAGITPAQSSKVLEVLGIDKLPAKLEEVQAIVSRPDLANDVLNLGRREIEERARVFSAESVKLENLTLAIKPEGFAGFMV